METTGRCRVRRNIQGLTITQQFFSQLPSSFIPIPQLPEARWNPGAAKASDCEVSKSFCALARRSYEARHPLEAPLIDVCSESEAHQTCCRRVAPRVFANRNCGIRVYKVFKYSINAFLS